MSLEQVLQRTNELLEKIVEQNTEALAIRSEVNGAAQTIAATAATTPAPAKKIAKAKAAESTALTKGSTVEVSTGEGDAPPVTVNTAAVKEVVAAPAAAAGAPSDEEMTKLILEVAAMPAGNAPIKELLDRYGVKRGRELPAEHRPAVVHALKEVKAGRPLPAHTEEVEDLS